MLPPIGTFATSHIPAPGDVIGMVFGLLGLTYWWVWRRGRDPGVGWLAISWALFGAWFVSTAVQPLVGPYLVSSVWDFVLVGGTASMSLGLADYLELRTPQRRRAVAAMVAPFAIPVALSLYVGLTGALVARWINNAPLAAWYATMGIVIWRAGRRDRDTDHRLVAATFLALPPVFIGRAITASNPADERYLAAVPIIMFGLSVLTSTLLRRRRNLEAEVARRCAAEAQLIALNTELEARVNERTEELRTANAELRQARDAAVERHSTLLAVQQAEARYRTLAEWTPEAIAVLRDGAMLYANPALAAMFGARSAGELVGKPVLDLVHPAFHDVMRRQLKTLMQDGVSELVNRAQCVRLDGSVIDVETKAIDITFDGKSAVYVVVRDITARLKAEANIQRLAYYDDLTGLPNRRLFLDRLAESLDGARASGQFGALMFLDLDNFKHLNDARGHALGDRLLVEVAKRVAAALQPEDTFARLGGDEFVVIVNRLGADVSMAEIASMGIAETIRLMLASTFDIEGNRYSGTGSIGLTLFPKPGDGADNLLREADTAMYKAKLAGRNRIAYFEPTMQSEAEERFALVGDLKDAIDAGQIEVHVQPQFEAGNAETGGELLLRWNHHARGAVSPAYFIPIAEESGLILRLGDLVLRRACEALAQMEQDGCLVPLSVNISPVQFHQDDFVARMRAMLAATRARATHLVFEVTEGLFIDKWQRVAARMTELAEMGIRFSIDDFGTGYSSLAYLKKLPLQEIKIDRQFVQNTPLDANDRAIVVSIIAVARSFNLRIVAEGVETQAQADILAREGCDCYQGFLFARPLPLEAWLARRRQSPAADRPQRKAVAY
ncbi:MAG: EAL domain-containing protein [Steroidobacterales bacterium]